MKLVSAEFVPEELKKLVTVTHNDETYFRAFVAMASEEELINTAREFNAPVSVIATKEGPLVVAFCYYPAGFPLDGLPEHVQKFIREKIGENGAFAVVTKTTLSRAKEIVETLATEIERKLSTYHGGTDEQLG